MWKRGAIPVAAVLTGLVACNTPSTDFRGVPATTVTVSGSVFDVRRRGTRVELLRRNAQYAPTFASIIPAASQAVILATGCRARPDSWEGEQTLMQVEVECPGGL